MCARARRRRRSVKGHERRKAGSAARCRCRCTPPRCGWLTITNAPLEPLQHRQAASCIGGPSAPPQRLASCQGRARRARSSSGASGASMGGASETRASEAAPPSALCLLLPQQHQPAPAIFPSREARHLHAGLPNSRTSTRGAGATITAPACLGSVCGTAPPRAAGARGRRRAAQGQPKSPRPCVAPPGTTHRSNPCAGLSQPAVHAAATLLPHIRSLGCTNRGPDAAQQARDAFAETAPRPQRMRLGESRRIRAL